MQTADVSGALDWVADRKDEMIALIRDLVNIDSPSHDPKGVAAVRDRLAAFFAEHGVATRRVPTGGGPDALAAWHRHGPSNRPPGLLLGHMDTVFPAGEAARRPFRVEGRRAYGPGVADMKAGLVMNAFVIAALVRHDVPVPLSALFTVDEEIGSPASRAVIEAEARGAAYVFNSEPGRISGNVVSGRRGGAFYRVTVTGRAAHAGLNPDDGRSAIVEMARKILAWTALTDPDAGISVSVGLMSGGQAVNMIAPAAEAQIDLRFSDLAGGEAAEAGIRRIAETAFTPDVEGRLEAMGKFLPMVGSEGSEALTRTYLSAAADCGLSIAAEFTPSCADSGLTSSLGIPTLCACGPVGGKAHSPEEYLELDSIVPRTRTLILAVASAAGPG